MRKLLLACIILNIFFTANLRAQEWEEITKSLPIPYGNTKGFNYGYSVSVDGDYAIVGSIGYNNIQSCSYVLHYNGINWEALAKLNASDSNYSDGFGYVVDISGDYIIIGSKNDDDNGSNSGSAYVFEKPAGGWVDMTQTAKLIASDGNIDDWFGSSVSISGDNIVIGAYGDSYGSAYVFTKPARGWVDMTETAKLTALDGGIGDLFGRSVSISGDCIVVGAYGYNSMNDGKGIAYVFEKPIGGWINSTETSYLRASDGRDFDHFGYSVAIKENLIVVGAIGVGDLVGPHSSRIGAAYIFEKPLGNSSYEIAILTASDGTANDYFGSSVSISGNNIVIGADQRYDNSSSGGLAYIFEKPVGGWVSGTETAKLIASDVSYRDYFGSSVSISGDNIIVGAYSDDDHCDQSGSTYLFKKPVSGWVNSEETSKIMCPDSTNTEDYYGNSVSIYGNYAVIGAKGFRNNKGRVHVLYYNETNWEVIANLSASDGSIDDKFGSAVKISGDCILVGVYKDEDDDNEDGCVYVFEKPLGGWVDMTETAKLTASDGEKEDWFGYSLDIDILNDFIVVGAYGDDDNGSSSGSVYVYQKPANGWETNTETAKIIASDGAAYDYFGYSVGCSEDNIVVGAYNDSSGSGSVYVFEKPLGGWVDMNETAKLKASDRHSRDNFGISLSISGNSIAVGAKGDDDNGSASGSVYVFEEPTDGWVNSEEQAKLTAFDGEKVDFFGASVCISGNRIVIGANWDDDNGSASGSVYLFEKPISGWINSTQAFKFISSDGNNKDEFGCSVSISGDHFVVGAFQNDDNGSNSGSAYFFKHCNSVDFKNIICQGEDFEYALINPKDGAEFRWQENIGTSWTDINAETNDTLIIPNITLGMHGFQYRCIISGISDDTTDVATLNVNPAYNEIENVNECSGSDYIFPDGTTQNNITSQVIHVSSLQTVFGCDSIIETTVNVNPVYNLTETVIINTGGSYTFPDGTAQNNITSQVIYTSYLHTINGCDSIIETTVNAEQIQDCYFAEEVEVCSGSYYLFPDGTLQSNITSQVVHESIIPSVSACDTIIKTTVNVNHGEVTYLNETICEGETFQLGYAILSSPGLYGVTLTNQYGCDSLVNLDLTVIELDLDLGLDKTIDINDTITLDAGENFETYYWNTEETTQTILIDSSYGVGSHTFDVLVTDENDCTETDNITITISDITDISFNGELEGNIKLYPNPTSGKINIDLTEIDESIEISIINILGKILLQKELNSNESSFAVEIPGDSGVYFVKLSSDLKSKTYKIIKE